MVKLEGEGSDDQYKITLSDYSDALKDHPSRRKPIQDVVDLYDRIRRGGNMNNEVQGQFFKDISRTKWATRLKTAGSKHGSYKELTGNGGRDENRRFSNWVIVSACWPYAERLPEIRANMAKYWGIETFPDGEFPKVADGEQMKLYLGKLEKHPSKSKSRTTKSSAKTKGKGSQKPDQGGEDHDDHDSGDDHESSDDETDDEVIVDEESTKAAQEARDKTLWEEAWKAKNSDPDQIDQINQINQIQISQIDQVNQESDSSGLTTMEKIKKARANMSKAYGAKRPADPTPAMDPPLAKRADTHSASDLQAMALADLLRDLSSDRERLQKLEEESRQTREKNQQLEEENRQLRERADKVEAAHYDLEKRHADFEKETMDTLMVLLDAAQGKTTSEATEAVWTAVNKGFK